MYQENKAPWCNLVWFKHGPILAFMLNTYKYVNLKSGYYNLKKKDEYGELIQHCRDPEAQAPVLANLTIPEGYDWLEQIAQTVINFKVNLKNLLTADVFRQSSRWDLISLLVASISNHGSLPTKIVAFVIVWRLPSSQRPIQQRQYNCWVWLMRWWLLWIRLCHHITRQRKEFWQLMTSACTLLLVERRVFLSTEDRKKIVVSSYKSLECRCMLQSNIAIQMLKENLVKRLSLADDADERA